MPAFSNPVLPKSADPVAPITKYRFVKATGLQGPDNVGDKIQVTAIAANTDTAIAVATESVTSIDIGRGKGLPVMLQGIQEMEAGNAVAAGDQIATDAVGRATTLGASGAGTNVYGIAMTGCAALGDRVAVLLDF